MILTSLSGVCNTCTHYEDQGCTLHSFPNVWAMIDKCEDYEEASE
jgi:hypothetical protein